MNISMSEIAQLLPSSPASKQVCTAHLPVYPRMQLRNSLV